MFEITSINAFPYDSVQPISALPLAKICEYSLFFNCIIPFIPIYISDGRFSVYLDNRFLWESMPTRQARNEVDSLHRIFIQMLKDGTVAVERNYTPMIKIGEVAIERANFREIFEYDIEVYWSVVGSDSERRVLSRRSIR